MNIIKKISLIFKFVFDKQIPLKQKWWVIIPVIYILSPIDLIPAPIIGFSIIDDIIMLAFLLSVVEGKTDKYYGNEQNEFYEQNNKNNKNNNNGNNKEKEEIIEGVEYKVEKDDE